MIDTVFALVTFYSRFLTPPHFQILSHFHGFWPTAFKLTDESCPLKLPFSVSKPSFLRLIFMILFSRLFDIYEPNSARRQQVKLSPPAQQLKRGNIPLSALPKKSELVGLSVISTLMGFGSRGQRGAMAPLDFHTWYRYNR